MTLTLDDMAASLQDRLVGVIGTDIFKGYQPPSPDNCITLYEYGGPPPEIVGNIEHPMVQVRIRNTSYSTGSTKANTVLKTLHNMHEKTINGWHYLFVEAMQSPEHLGVDPNKRHEWVINFHVMRDLE